MTAPELTNLIQTILTYAIPVLFGITVHEVAHGWMARRCGDRTAEMMGRLTLNPIKHIDPIGTIAVPLILVVIFGFAFGWAKPVPVSFRNLNNPRRDMIAVALAGPGANLLMALGWAVVCFGLQIIFPTPGSVVSVLIFIALNGIFFNLLLMIFNLIPIPPLDGGRVLRGLVSEPVGRQLDAFERYGLILVLGLIYLGLLGPVIDIAKRITALLVVG